MRYLLGVEDLFTAGVTISLIQTSNVNPSFGAWHPTTSSNASRLWTLLQTGSYIVICYAWHYTDLCGSLGII